MVETGLEAALRTCLQVFEALGEHVAATACRRALGLVEQNLFLPAPAGLTRREQCVAALLAAGSTNRQIARALHISPGTAGRHVANIFLKLGFHSRAQVASWNARRLLAQEQGGRVGGEVAGCERRAGDQPGRS